jgi:hypothetical protein
MMQCVAFDAFAGAVMAYAMIGIKIFFVVLRFFTGPGRQNSGPRANF